MNKYKTIKLTDDDLIMGFKKNDELVVDTTLPLQSGSLVVTYSEGAYQICRYEQNDGLESLWPPRSLRPENYREVILGQAIELNRAL